MKMRLYNIIVLIFMLFSCRLSTNNKETVSIRDTLISTNREFEKGDKKSIINNFKPYTKNPIWINNNKIYMDSLSPFFKYKDIDRLDILCNKIENWYNDSLKEIVFSNKCIKTKSQTDSVCLNNYQFLVGNSKTNKNQPDIIVILNYIEDWGYEIYFLAVDKNHAINDILLVYESGGDGGDFNRTQMVYRNQNNYYFINKLGRQTFTSPVDSIIYSKTSGIIKLKSDGFFEKRILQKKSNIRDKESDKITPATNVRLALII